MPTHFTYIKKVKRKMVITALNKKGAVFLFYKGADRQDINA